MFIVMDRSTGCEVDVNSSEFKSEVLHSDWSKDLTWTGFALLPDGTLVLLDEYGSYVYCPDGRFEVVEQ